MVGPRGGCWFKSSFSNDTANCVEVRFVEAEVQVRHSGKPSGAVLGFARGEWEAFLLGAFNGEFDFA